jgi:hypothetical protein
MLGICRATAAGPGANLSGLKDLKTRNLRDLRNLQIGKVCRFEIGEVRRFVAEVT